jgi:hypothetical protein
MKYGQKEFEFIVGRINHLLFELNEWETDFMASITPRVKNGIVLTNKQQEIVSKIWDRLEDL